MAGINKVILIGNLGAEPEIRYMPSGDAIANVRLATSEQWRDKNTGQTQERTEWHSVVFFGKLAEIVKQYLHKGSKIYVEGKLRTRKWQTQDGQDRYSTEVVVDISGTMQMLDGKRDAPQQPDAYTGPATWAPTTQPAKPTQRRPAQANTPPAAGTQGFDDDIPF